MSTRTEALARHPLPACAAALAAVVLAAPGVARADASPDNGVRLRKPLNDTGMTRCTRDFVTFTKDCAGTGQDAETGRDVTKDGQHDGKNGFSFSRVCNNGETAGVGTCSREATLGPGPDDWGCTTDRVTGLTWEVKTADGGLRDGGNTYTNLGGGAATDASGYVAAVNAAGLCGASDWRMPTTYELESLVDYNRRQRAPAIDTDWFPNSAASSWWSGDAYYQQPTVGWFVRTRMDNANVNAAGLTRSTALYVRLVRDTPPLQAPVRFETSADGQEVIDPIARLAWRRCVEGMHFDGTSCVGKAAQFKESEAYAHANDAAARSGLPWRVPNVKELHSITDETVNTPAIDSAMFPDTPAGKTWTSTVISWVAPTGGWVVDFNDARLVAYAAYFGFPVRLVRTISGKH